MSRERIVDAAIALLDAGGADGLTFRALAERLATGAGAIYYHVANKSDLLTAACDSVIARTLAECAVEGSPAAQIRAIALGLFDAIDAHAWVGSALAGAPGELPGVRILERIGRQVDALGVPHGAQWAAVCALVNYIMGVAGQNAANSQIARTHAYDRASLLDAMATRWSQLDAQQFSFTRSVADQLRNHDDRADYLTGLDLILQGMETLYAHPGQKD